MPSESPHFKKYFRRIVPISSKGQQLVRPMRSLDLGDIATNIMRTSLAVLTDGSALATMIPYIPAVAGLLLLLLSMQGEVKLCKTQWRVAMQRLFDLAIIVVEIGEICRAHNLKEEDLPAHFRLIFQSIHTDLRGIVEAFKECAETRGIMKHLLRPGMLRRIRQYESKLSHALQASQATLARDVRFAQNAQERMSTNAGQVENGPLPYRSVNGMTHPGMPPTAPPGIVDTLDGRAAIPLSPAPESRRTRDPLGPLSASPPNRAQSNASWATWQAKPSSPRSTPSHLPLPPAVSHGSAHIISSWTTWHAECVPGHSRPPSPEAKRGPLAARSPPSRSNWATWQVQPGVEYTPPPTEPTIYLVPEVPPPRGLFGPRSPRSSWGDLRATPSPRSTPSHLPLPPAVSHGSEQVISSWATWHAQHVLEYRQSPSPEAIHGLFGPRSPRSGGGWGDSPEGHSPIPFPSIAESSSSPSSSSSYLSDIYL